MDELNADIVELLEVIAPLLDDGPTQHEHYTAILVGLEGEEIAEFSVPAEPSGNPPHIFRLATALPVKLLKLEKGALNFAEVEYHARAQCSKGCCVWYYRLTGPWGD